MSDNLEPRNMKEQTTQPLVSVVVPCYNQGQYLADLVESVNASCFSHHEVLIIDDGSTDSLTRRCLARIRSEGPRQEVRVISRANGGLPAARNTGLDAARGRYIQFLDSDDLVTQNKLDLQIEAMEADPSIDVHLTEFVMCDASRSRFWRLGVSTIAGFEYDPSSFVKYWERGLTIPIHCGLFRASAIGAIRFNEQLRAKEDWIFWVTLATTGARFAYSDFVGAVYRQHDSNMCKDGRSMALSYLRAIQHLRNMGAPLDEESQKSLLEHYNRFYVRFFGTVDAVNPSPTLAHDEVNYLLSFAK
ncbi:glycosyl transferase [Burkholderia sp. SFA1]|nr:glycosyl transferase [Burkholderia sp. SFA1]